MANSLYPGLLNLKGPVIQKNLNATLLNSEIYIDVIKVEIADEDKSEKFKQLALIRKDKLKELKAMMDNEYSEYPEFLYTEAYLEFQESMNLESAKLRLNKVDFALGTLKRAMATADRLKGFKIENFRNLLSKLTKSQERLLKKLDSKGEI